MGVADDQLVGKLESSCKAKLEEPPELPLTAKDQREATVFRSSEEGERNAADDTSR
jgi:hypothetical protein